MEHSAFNFQPNNINVNAFIVSWNLFLLRWVGGLTKSYEMGKPYTDGGLQYVGCGVIVAVWESSSFL